MINGRALFILANDAVRSRVKALIDSVPDGFRVELKEPKRTTEQNDLMWATLTDIASQLDYHGLKLSTDDWKKVFLDALNRETRLVPNLDGDGFVNLNNSSSDLGKREMSDMVTIMHVYGAERGVVFHDQEFRSGQRAR